MRERCEADTPSPPEQRQQHGGEVGGVAFDTGARLAVRARAIVGLNDAAVEVPAGVAEHGHDDGEADQER